MKITPDPSLHNALVKTGGNPSPVRSADAFSTLEGAVRQVSRTQITSTTVGRQQERLDEQRQHADARAFAREAPTASTRPRYMPKGQTLNILV